MRIAFVDTVHPFLHENLIKSGFECVFIDEIDSSNAARLLKDTEGIIIRSKFIIDRQLIDQLPELKFIARVGAGMENIDFPYAESRGVRCLNAPEGNRNAVAEHALGMLLALLNNIVKADREVRNGKWIREQNRGNELEGKTIALIGYGNTGRAFAKILRGFDIRLLVYDKYVSNYGDDFVQKSDMEQIYEQADIVSIHIPLTTETTYLVNTSFINRFKKPIYLINTSRGKCLKTEDLSLAMREGKVRGVALDVIEYESISFEEISRIPEPMKYILESERAVLSPHIAGWTHESNLKMAQILLKKIMNLSLPIN